VREGIASFAADVLFLLQYCILIGPPTLAAGAGTGTAVEHDGRAFLCREL
jgi:hypothetical protein